MSEWITRVPSGLNEFFKILEQHLPANLLETAYELLGETDDELSQLSRAIGLIKYLKTETQLESEVEQELLDSLDDLSSSVRKKSRLN